MPATMVIILFTLAGTPMIANIEFESREACEVQLILENDPEARAQGYTALAFCVDGAVNVSPDRRAIA